MTEAAHPAVSIVVYAREAVHGIRDALRSLLAQDGIEDAEVIVADCSSDGTTAIIEREFPTVRRLALGPLTMPVGKARAIRAARGEIIAILDAHDRAAPGWLRAARRALDEEGFEAVGGEVLFEGPMKPANLAGYLFEYGAFAGPLDAGPTEHDLPGNNVAYRRRVFTSTCRDLLEHGFYKPFFHRRIRDRGGVLGIVPAMRVHHRIHMSLVAFCRRRYHYGRCFGAMRLERASGTRAVTLKVFAPAAIAILSARHVRRAWHHTGNRRLLLGSPAGILVLCWSWGTGEWVGAWRGAGGSCDMVY